MQYRTEIYIAPDRYVCLQLPDFIPAGRATVTVSVAVVPQSESESASSATDPGADLEPDGGDIEWWDEFDAEDDPRRG